MQVKKFPGGAERHANDGRSAAQISFLNMGRNKVACCLNLQNSIPELGEFLGKTHIELRLTAQPETIFLLTIPSTNKYFSRVPAHRYLRVLSHCARPVCARLCRAPGASLSPPEGAKQMEQNICIATHSRGHRRSFCLPSASSLLAGDFSFFA